MASIMKSQDFFKLFCGEGFHLDSLCIQRTVADVVNLGFLLTYYLGLIITSFSRKQVNDIRTRNSIIPSLCCAAISAVHLVFGFMAIYSRYDITQCVVIFSRWLIWMSLAVSIQISPPKCLKPIILTWWVSFSLLTSALNLETLIRFHNTQVFDMMQWLVSLLPLLCAFGKFSRSSESLSEPLLIEEDQRKASIFSRLTFSWLNPLLRTGSLKTLTINDIPPLGTEDEANFAYQTFMRIFEQERKNKSRTNNLVLFALAKCYKKEMLLVRFYALSKTVAVSLAPLLLYVFVWYSKLEVKNTNIGVFLIVLLLVDKVVESLSQRHWFFDSRRYGMRMRSAIMSSIYSKQLKLSSTGRKRHSTGEIANYIAVDAYRLGDCLWWFHMAWSLPLQLVFSVSILFGIVGYGAIPGLIPLIILGILNFPIAKMIQNYQCNFMIEQDERLRATSEILNNFKIIKLNSWEEIFKNKIVALRDKEFKWLKDTQMTKAYGTGFYWMSPTVVSAFIFAGTAMVSESSLRNAGTIFTVLATLRVMSEPVSMLSQVLSVMIQLKVSLDRIGVFLLEDELREEGVRRNYESSGDFSVEVRNGCFGWELSANVATLRDVNLCVKRGEKVAVCGPVGAGKSSFLCAVLGEIPKVSGYVSVFGSVAYVSQTSWIQSGTIRDNVLFGKPMNKTKYENALRCCALDKDIDSFDHGDMTEIGQRGLNMSGGQKQRIQLARAVYNDADIYLLDDPFSAVDAHTASILFHECVMRALGNKTVILVTHQVEFLPETDKIIVIENGQVTQCGTYTELLKSGTAFEGLVNAHESSMTEVGTSTEENHQEPIRQQSENEISSISTVQLTESEETETGNLGWKPYKDYFQVSRGYFILAWMILCQIVFVALQSLSTYWLARAVQIEGISSAVLVGVYAATSILSCVFACFRSILSAILGLKASKEFFAGFMDSVFKAPMVFFDSTPVGRILTRASSDMSILDFDIPYSIAFVLAPIVEMMAIIGIIAAVTWQVLIVAIPVLVMIIYVQNYYLASARELVRINGTTKAPLVNFVSESILGAVSIRAFSMTERFFQTNLKHIDIDATMFFYTIAALEWVLIRVEALQILTIVSSTLILILLPQETISPGFLGLCLSYSLSLSQTQVFLTRWYSNLENYIISAERIKQFMHIQPEPPAIIHERRPEPSWPNEGRINLQSLKVKYRVNLPYVLKGITCTFEAGNKVGVVGRTGSGKTTLISSLFRLVDPADGSIVIDGIDICSIGLKDLRSKLSIIPQEPTLFRGSIRTNLDPLGLYTDNDIWEALAKCQLKSTISNLPLLLDSQVNDDGDNWSAGQRQLFCLGRVLLRKNKILVLDEATASIDSATDKILQEIIKKEFLNCTVITIAHRVPTVIESDMVMVLSYGKLLEYEKPSRLLENSSSAFAKLVAEYWSNCKRNIDI